MTILISMLPVVELRGGIPYGVAAGLSYPAAMLAACVGNMIPVPFILLLIRRIFAWLKRFLSVRRIIEKLEMRGHLKSRLVNRYRLLGLVILVAVPLPGTGAWTGALVAAMLDIRLKTAFPAILLGVCIAAGVITALTYGVTAVV